VVPAPSILVDTSAYYALKDKDDVFHSRALLFIQTNEFPVVTTNLVIIETLNLVSQRLGHRHSVELGKKLFDPEASDVINVSDEDVARAWRIFQQYKDKGFSFTDCTSFAVMERLKIRAALAFDEHFRQYGRFIVHPGVR
jgi:predicted nucleic acid-binding protein